MTVVSCIVYGLVTTVLYNNLTTTELCGLFQILFTIIFDHNDPYFINYIVQ